MKTVDYLIVGGGVAGATAAEVLRRHDARASIHVITAEPYRFYERKMLSKPDFFLGQAPFESVFMKPESWFEHHQIGTTLGHPATKLDVAKKTVTVDSGEQFAYGKLLIATGVSVCPWEVPGADKESVLHLRTLDDAKQVIAAVRTAQRAVIVGGGFIGYEMCHLLATAKIDTTLVIREKYFWEPMLDEGTGRMIEAALEKAGIYIIHQALVEEVVGDQHATGVKLNNGQTLMADLVMVGIGTTCALEWVAGTGIACHRGILTNEYLETNLPDIWAAGDVAEYKDLILHESVQMGNWENAHLQGRAAAMNMLGHRHPFHHVSFYTTRGFGIALSFVGDIRVNEGRTVLRRGSPEAGAYTRIILDGNRVLGATMLNRPQDLEPLGRIIEHELPVDRHRQQLSDPDFDLRKIRS